MKLKLLFVICASLLINTHVFSQERSCGSTIQQWNYLRQQPRYFELLKKAMQAQQKKTTILSCDTIKIPVVVHVVYNTNEQNIGDEQVQSQIDALNEDFAAINATITDVPVNWKPFITDSKIRFSLANRAPDNTNSNGITRTQTSLTSFYILDSRVKFDTAGGINAWPASSYLNIWVCNLNDALGYAQFPGVQPEEDGIVINYKAFGRSGDLNKKYNLGRTVTHEVGHWFRLFHISGDDDPSTPCVYDDEINDTPLQAIQTFGSPKYPKYDVCTAGGDGIMFMNYMDYTDDKAMMFFTPDQIDTMRTYFELFRDSICFSQGNQLVNRLNHDLQLEAIVSPITQTDQRCFSPIAIVRNNGLDTISSFQIIYNMVDRTKRLYQWKGTLASDSSVTITMPPISGSEGLNVLEMRIAETDDNTTNNYRSCSFKVEKENTTGCEDCDPLIYPNPVTTHSFCVKSCFITSDLLTIRVINMLGQTVIEIPEVKSNPGDIFPVNMGYQTKGVYVVQLINGDQSRGAKLIYLPGEGAFEIESVCD